jgi:hypothetical protein
VGQVEEDDDTEADSYPYKAPGTTCARISARLGAARKAEETALAQQTTSTASMQETFQAIQQMGIDPGVLCAPFLSVDAKGTQVFDNAKWEAALPLLKRIATDNAKVEKAKEKWRVKKLVVQNCECEQMRRLKIKAQKKEKKLAREQERRQKEAEEQVSKLGFGMMVTGNCFAPKGTWGEADDSDED